MIRIAALLVFSLIVFPLVVFAYGTGLSGLQWSMLKHSGLMAAGAATYCFVVSRLTNNVSQVDKLWSIMPVVYVWYFAFAAEWNARVVLMAVLVTIWGVRLTFNFARRGGYSWKFWTGEEDYRWEVLRQRPEFQKRWVWALFDFFFISFYQHALIWLFTLPAVMAAGGARQALTVADVVIAVLMLGFIAIETTADQQQWNFQNRKHAKKNAGEPMNDEEQQGFVSSGLWAVVRHPNYAAEQAIWITFYFFSVAATGEWVNWSLAGALLLLLLFKGSSDFSEGISQRKYPAYADYKTRVPRFIPKIFGR